jgi:hypothetical protein
MQSDVSRTICLSVRRTARLRPTGLRRGSLRASSSSFSRCSRARSAGLPSRSADRREGWWSLSGSNRRPHACKARALPAELRPHDRKDECESRRIVETTDLPKFTSTSPPSPFGLRRDSLRLSSGLPSRSADRREGWWAWEDLNFRPHAYQARALTN